MKHHPSQLTQLQMTRASPVIDEGSAISIFLEEEHQRDSGRQVRSEAALALLAAAVMLLLHYNTHCDYLCVFSLYLVSWLVYIPLWHTVQTHPNLHSYPDFILDVRWRPSVKMHSDFFIWELIVLQDLETKTKLVCICEVSTAERWMTWGGFFMHHHNDKLHSIGSSM